MTDPLTAQQFLIMLRNDSIRRQRTDHQRGHRELMRVRLTAPDLGSRLLGVTVAVGVVFALAFAILSERDEQRPVAIADDHGIPPCSARAEEDLLSWNALQCWFQARRGRWRTLSSVSLSGVLVVETEAADIRDAEEIAQRFVTAGGGQFVEVLVHVRREPSDAAPLIRRLRWTRSGGFDTLEFTGVSTPWEGEGSVNGGLRPEADRLEVRRP